MEQKDEQPGGTQIEAPNFVNFTSPDVTHESFLQLTPTDKHWQWVWDGFNYAGYCQNKRCISHSNGKKGFVVKNRGYGTIRPSEDCICGYVKCPGCDEEFIPTEFIVSHGFGDLKYCEYEKRNLVVIQICVPSKDVAKTFGSHITPKLYSMLVFRIERPEREPDLLVRSNDDDSNHEEWNKEETTRRQNDKDKRDETTRRQGRSLVRTEEPPDGWFNPKTLRYCGHEMDDAFACGRSLEQTYKELMSGSKDIKDIPIMRVFESDGKWYSVDNKRLYVYRRIADFDVSWEVPIKIVQRGLVSPEKLTTKNEGRDINIKVRPDSQSREFIKSGHPKSAANK